MALLNMDRTPRHLFDIPPGSELAFVIALHKECSDELGIPRDPGIYNVYAASQTFIDEILLMTREIKEIQKDMLLGVLPGLPLTPPGLDPEYPIK